MALPGRKDKHLRVSLRVTIRVPSFYSSREIDEVLRRTDLFRPILTGPVTFRSVECSDWETIDEGNPS